jgi:hypothetical protein
MKICQSYIGCSSFALVRLSLPPLSLSLSHAHTHTNTSSDKVLAFNIQLKKNERLVICHSNSLLSY